LIKVLNHLDTNKKRKEDKGHCCHRPQYEFKKLEGEPFIRTIKEVDERHPIIHSIVCRFILRWSNNNLRHN